MGLQPARSAEGGSATGSPDEPVSMLDYACGQGLASRVSERGLFVVFWFFVSVYLSVYLFFFFSSREQEQNSRSPKRKQNKTKQTTRNSKGSAHSFIQALFPYVSTLRGIDISDGMVEKYNHAARSQGLSEQQMYAVQGDLLSPTTTSASANSKLQGADFFNFSIIVISMALHHIEHPQELIKKLVGRLRPGGAIVVIDWVPEIGNSKHDEQLQQQQQPAGEHSPSHNAQKNNDQGGQGAPHHHHHHQHQHGTHSASHTVAHAGFTQDQMLKMLREGGCAEVDFVLHPERSRVPREVDSTGEKQLFFARGKKGV